jgi:serine palmitoyltransferase
MGTDEAIIYSYDIATISSVIPAFANRKDVLVVDEVGFIKQLFRDYALASTWLLTFTWLGVVAVPQLCSFPIQQGATLSRAAVHWFKHNDMEDLERVLKAVEQDARRHK